MFKIKAKGKSTKAKKKGRRTLMESLKETVKPETSKPQIKAPQISESDAKFVRMQLETGTGKNLLRALEPISRRDLHPSNLNISYDPEIRAVDVHIIFIDTNTPLWANLQRVMWRNRMTWRFDGTGPQLMLIVRWFLPYEMSLDPLAEHPPQPKEENLEPPTAQEEVGQTKQSTIEAKDAG